MASVELVPEASLSATIMGVTMPMFTTKKIGEGSHGEVYKGMLKVAPMLERNGALPPRDLPPPKNQVVAIKTLNPIVPGSANETRFGAKSG